MTQSQSTRRPTRGVRNFNPGNIRRVKGVNWQGAAPVQLDREFVTFVSAEMGVRALVRTLLTYYKQHKLKSVRTIIARWAPENGDRNGSAPGGEYRQNTSAYIDAVCREMGTALGRTINADSVLDIDSRAVMRPLIVAIIAHENAGFRYPSGIIDDGLRLAGIADAPPRALLSDGQVQGALVSGGAVGISGAVEIIKIIGEVRSQLEPAASHSQIIVVALVVLAFAGAAYTIWSHIDRKRKTLA